MTMAATTAALEARDALRVALELDKLDGGMYRNERPSVNVLIATSDDWEPVRMSKKQQSRRNTISQPATHPEIETRQLRRARERREQKNRIIK